NTRLVKRLYYGIAAAYVLWGISAFTFFPNLSGSTMMVIAGNVANMAIAATIFQTLYVNRRFLPRSMQPSAGKQLALILSGCFFLAMFGLVAQQKIIPYFANNLEQFVVILAAVAAILGLAWFTSHRSVCADSA